MTYREIYDITMPKSKRDDEKYLFWDRFFQRPPAILMTIPFINSKVKPTTVTKWSVFVSIISFFVIAWGPTVSIRVIGWFLFYLWGLLDCVDGQLARCTNQCSNLGDLWDTMGGYLAMIFAYFSAGIAAYYDANVFQFCDNYWMLIAGGATAVLSIFPRLIMQKKKNYGESKAVKEMTDKPSFSLSKLIIQNLISPSAFLQPIFLLSIVFHCLNYFIVIYFIINLLVTLVTLNNLLKD